jgi:hypothetical protein
LGSVLILDCKRMADIPNALKSADAQVFLNRFIPLQVGKRKHETTDTLV